MVLSLLVGTPLSNGYDFIGKPNHRRGPFREEVKEPPNEKPVKEELPKEDTVKVEKPVKEEVTVQKETAPVKPVAPKPAKKESAPVIQNTLPEPEVTPEPPKSNYTEIDYTALAKGNALANLPKVESGNYVIVYKTDNCPYCDKLIAELKDKIEDYHLVVVHCSEKAQDVFYNRWLSYYPSFIVITNKRVTYYGYGYRTLKEFKRLL